MGSGRGYGFVLVPGGIVVGQSVVLCQCSKQWKNNQALSIGEGYGIIVDWGLSGQD